MVWNVPFPLVPIQYIPSPGPPYFFSCCTLGCPSSRLNEAIRGSRKSVNLPRASAQLSRNGDQTPEPQPRFNQRWDECMSLFQSIEATHSTHSIHSIHLSSLVSMVT